VRQRDEPAAILTASEGSIYGRFGYGVAAWRLGITAERAHIAFAQDHGDDGRVRLVSRDEAKRVLPEIYERARGARAGMVTRPEFWWEQVYWDYMVRATKPNFVAVHADAQGRDDGYVVYDVHGDWEGGLPDRRLSIIDVQAESSATWISLWRYVFGVDLIGTVAAANLPVDDPLRHLVVDSRRVRVDYINDHLWLAPLDPLGLLGARSYAVDGRAVIEVNAPDGTKSTVAIESGPDGTSCVATTEAPDLACDSAALGMCALGGNRWSELVAADRVEVRRPEKLLLADAMFLASPAPALLSYF
jgi:predicted acetyltransferase